MKRRMIAFMLCGCALFSLCAYADVIEDGRSRWEARYLEAAAALGAGAEIQFSSLGETNGCVGFLYTLHGDIECAVYFYADGSLYGQMLYAYAQDAPIHAVMQALIYAANPDYDLARAEGALAETGVDDAAQNGTEYSMAMVDGWLYMITNAAEGGAYGFSVAMVRAEATAPASGGESAPEDGAAGSDGDIWDGLWGDEDGETPEPGATTTPAPAKEAKIHKI